MKPKKIFNKSGYAWLIDFYDPQGKRVKRRFKKLADAEAVLAMVKVAKLEGNYGEKFGKKPEPEYRFDDLARDYLETYRGQKSYQDKQQIVNQVLLPAFSGASLKSITYRELELFRSRRVDTPTWCGKKRSPARINRELAVLRHFFSKAKMWGRLEVSPFEKGESIFFRENNERIRYLIQEESGRLLAACQDHLRPIVETALNTGMRKGEILSLKWEQVRDGWVYLVDTKSGKGRPVPINDTQAEVFRELQALVQLTSPYVFSVRNNVNRSWASALRRAGIMDFKFHDLRHTCASWLVMAGASLVVVQKQLGHASIKTTMRYAHLAPGHMKAAINLIGSREVKGKTGKTGSVLGV